jgi:hypothetical protein
VYAPESSGGEPARERRGVTRRLDDIVRVAAAKPDRLAAEDVDSRNDLDRCLEPRPFHAVMLTC